MPKIKPDCLRDLKLRVNLADVVARSVTLKKAGGARLKGLCPFHREKTPSFHVDSDKGVYHCFGCGKSGDVISFVRETELLDFNEAVETLGKRFGIVIEYQEGGGGPGPAERSLREQIFAIHDQAAEHFHGVFKAAGPAGDFMRAYWVEQRRFSLELADEFKIGAVAAAGDGLGALLMRKGFNEDALRQCGLFFIREDALLTVGALRPRFRGRLLIPIRDHQGRVCAFTARQTTLTPADDPAREAKYVNSPETPIFIKGNLLFNLDRARLNAGEGRPFVLVEGQLDALRCWSVGLKTAVAPQGTSITEGQLALLRRYHSQVECFFDGDDAGRKAALRFAPMALKAGLEARFLSVAGTEKSDPDVLFLARGLAAYEEVRKNALGIIAFACQALLPDPAHASTEQKVRAAGEIRDLIEHAQSQVARSGYLAEAESCLKIRYDSLLGDAKGTMGVGTPGKKAEASPSAHFSAGLSVGTSSEHDLLLVCLHYEEVGRRLSRYLPHEWIDPAHPAGVLLGRFLGEMEHGEWPGRGQLDELLETDAERALVAALLFANPRIDDPVKVAVAGLTQLRARALEPKIRQIELALANAQADSKVDAISLYKQRTELQRQLRAPIVLPAAV